MRKLFHCSYLLERNDTCLCQVRHTRYDPTVMLDPRWVSISYAGLQMPCFLAPPFLPAPRPAGSPRGRGPLLGAPDRQTPRQHPQTPYTVPSHITLRKGAGALQHWCSGSRGGNAADPRPLMAPRRASATARDGADGGEAVRSVPTLSPRAPPQWPADSRWAGPLAFPSPLPAPLLSHQLGGAIPLLPRRAQPPRARAAGRRGVGGTLGVSAGQRQQAAAAAAAVRRRRRRGARDSRPRLRPRATSPRARGGKGAGLAGSRSWRRRVAGVVVAAGGGRGCGGGRVGVGGGGGGG